MGSLIIWAIDIPYHSDKFMCGITGFFSLLKDFSPERFSKANNIIRHRGPDDFGYITINNRFEVESWMDEDLSDFSGADTIGAFGFRTIIYY